jgi:ABC-2 type transport system permease protein
MSTATPLATQPTPTGTRPARPTPAGRVTFANVVRSEWIKFWTLRSTWIVLLSTVAALIGIALLAGYALGSTADSADAVETTASDPLTGYNIAQLLIGVLGVLFVAGEYSTGMIRASMTAVPTRWPVLAAKAVVFAAVTTVAMVLASFVAFFAAQLFLSHYDMGHSLSEPGVLRAVVGTGVYLALAGLLGSAFGWMLRSVPGGISTLVGVLMVLPIMLALIPVDLADTVSKYLPGSAGGSFISVETSNSALGPWAGLLVMVIWVLGAFGVAAALLKRRDV